MAIFSCLIQNVFYLDELVGALDLRGDFTSAKVHAKLRNELTVYDYMR